MTGGFSKHNWCPPSVERELGLIYFLTLAKPPTLLLCRNWLGHIKYIKGESGTPKISSYFIFKIFNKPLIAFLIWLEVELQSLLKKLKKKQEAMETI